MTHAVILGLDISSSAIGWCLLQGIVSDHGVIRLDKKLDISERCLSAKNAIENLIARYALDAVALESPVARFASAVIPQARISGVVLATLAQHALAWCEVTPAAAKLALAGDGAASKQQMLQAAAPHFGYAAEALAYIKQRGDWMAITSSAGVFSEHEADALGVALAAAKLVSVEQVLV